MTAEEFFAQKLPGCSMQEAHVTTGLGYSTVQRAAQGGEPSVHVAKELQRWSLNAGSTHGVYISAAKTLGVEDPVTTTQHTASDFAGRKRR